MSRGGDGRTLSEEVVSGGVGARGNVSEGGIGSLFDSARFLIGKTLRQVKK